MPEPDDVDPGPLEVYDPDEWDQADPEPTEMDER